MSEDALIAHNTILSYADYAFRLGIRGCTSAGYQCIPIRRLEVSNNIIIGDDGEMAHQNTNALGDSYLENCDSRNAPYMGDGKNDITWKNNLYYNTGTAEYGYGYTIDPSPVTQDPLLTDNFHLSSNSPAINAGTNVPEVIVDYYNTSRHQGYAPDIGAFEYGNGDTMRGDVNGDNEVNIQDVMLCVNVMLGIEQDEVIIERADINEDGSVNILDVMRLVNIILGL